MPRYDFFPLNEGQEMNCRTQFRLNTPKSAIKMAVIITKKINSVLPGCTISCRVSTPGHNDLTVKINGDVYDDVTGAHLNRKRGAFTVTPSRGMTVLLRSEGNPDHHEYYGEGVKSPTETAHVAGIEYAVASVRDYIKKWDLGGGNWIGGEVRQDGVVIGRIHYNGRFEKK